MKRRTTVFFLLPLLAGGCTLLPPQPDTPAPVMKIGDPAQRADQLRGQARVLRYSGRYAEALSHLDQAIALQPDDPDLPVERTQTERSWLLMQEALQDRMRVIQATERIELLPLLVRLVRADTADTERQVQLQTLRDDLLLRVDGLSECGRRQAELAPDLARRCLQLALALRDEPGDQALLTKLEREVQARQPRRKTPTPVTPPDPQTPAAIVEASTVPEAAAAPERPELIKARELMQMGNPFGAVHHLQRLQENGLDTDESRRLLAQAEEALADSTKILLDAGDMLYRQGKVKEALALWDAALSVDPYNPDARRKSERAARVLFNLEVLDETKVPPASP